MATAKMERGPTTEALSGNVITAMTADGYASANLPSGQYRIDITTATAVFCDVVATVTTQ
jgi:hypothetical protein